MEVTIIYPHHLFKDHPALPLSEKFFIIEDPLFFKQYNFHKQKLAFHRASMMEYSDFLISRGKKVSYISADKIQHSEDIFSFITESKSFLVCDFDDDWLSSKIKSKAVRLDIKIRELTSPGFISPLADSVSILPPKAPLLMASFYQQQRRRTGILMDQGKPLGGKWSFDSDNRKKLPKNISIPDLKIPISTPKIREILESIKRDFPNNPGSCESLLYPTTNDSALLWLEQFLSTRFLHFGEFQDAITEKEPFLFHSVLSPLINAGLITPTEVINRTIEYAYTNNIPINSLEGFIRQILGWREFMRATYFKFGRIQRTKNFWNHQRKIPKPFWSGDTGILPVDAAIRRVLQYSYCHHIERLMVIGNFMLLCELDPDDIYRWFMELFIDAYDWVMVPNVYGMSQYADGGMITTKPYFSSSNYIRKMSNYKVEAWCEIWDGLFWSFINKHKDFFSKNPRLSMMSIQLERMDKLKLNKHLSIAEEYINKLYAF